MNGPATQGERIACLDALRGFALFGILLANILYWAGWIFIPEPQALALAGQSQFAIEAFLHKLLIDGKFYTIFSLLFGLGFALQLSRLERRGADGVRIYRRRLLVLLAIGLVHLCLMWDGDILTLYALLGLLLPLFRNWSERRTLVVVAALLLLPLPGAAIFQALGWDPAHAIYAYADRVGAALGGTPGHELEWLQRSDWASHWAWLMCGIFYRIGGLIESWRIPKVLGIMLLGATLGRRLVTGTLIENRALMRRTLAVGLLIGVPASLVYAASKGAGQDSIASVIGTVPLALAYAAGFVLLWSRLPWLGVLAATGRMALTNYLMHTVLGIAIFYGIGFGLVGRVPPIAFYGVAALIYAFQIVASNWWLARFEQGPMERLWRLGTYGRRGAATN